MMGGNVVEVKGVQKLNLVPKVVEYERLRQLGLIQIAEELRKRGVRRVKSRIKDVSGLIAESSSDVVKRTLTNGGVVCCIAAPGLGGLVGWEYSPGVRLGKELAEVARANSLGGIIHSDEFSRQGISEAEDSALRNELGCGPNDSLILIAGPRELVERCVPLIMARLEQATIGVPAETRAATDAGETRYMRPRPGSQRMYPETDIPVMNVSAKALKNLSGKIPPDSERELARLMEGYSLSRDLALKVYDSDKVSEFERLCGTLRIEPSFIASVLVDMPVRLAREGVPDDAFTSDVLAEILNAVGQGLVAKEAVPNVLSAVGKKGITVAEAIMSLGLSTADEDEVKKVVGSIISKHQSLIAERGEAAFSPLMGEVMKELRGRADGELVSRVLREELDRRVRSE
jgi:glutamyl-tRNA(Gln) amidotransferase subunit E